VAFLGLLEGVLWQLTNHTVIKNYDFFPGGVEVQNGKAKV
jgi:hypothetical protein